MRWASRSLGWAFRRWLLGSALRENPLLVELLVQAPIPVGLDSVEFRWAGESDRRALANEL